METPTGKQQWTLALLIFVLASAVLILYAGGSGLGPEIPLANVATLILGVALGFFSLALVGWGNRWGYLGAVGLGLLVAGGTLGSFAAMGRGDLPAELLITNLPLFIAGLGLIYAAYLGWQG